MRPRSTRSIHAAGLALIALVCGAARAGGPDAGATRPADAKPPSRAAVEAALVSPGHDAEDDLRRLAAAATPTLIVIASDAAAAPATRARAVSALAYGRARGHAFLENLVLAKTPSSDATDRLLLRRAALALGWQGGARVVETLAPLLDHDAADVRADAAAALSLGRSRDAEPPLRARLAIETDPAVKRQIEAALRAVAGTR